MYVFLPYMCHIAINIHMPINSDTDFYNSFPKTKFQLQLHMQVEYTTQQ